MSKSKPPYSAQFRQQMIELVQAGRKPSELAQEFGCHVTSLQSWVKQANLGAASGDSMLSHTEREELQRLRRENRQLRIERDILSKATAWFAKQGGEIAR